MHINNQKISNKKINRWKSQSTTRKESPLQYHSSNIKLFWDRMSLIDREESLTLFPNIIFKLLAPYLNYLDFSYIQFFQKQNSVLLKGNNQINLNFIDFANYKNFLRNENLQDKMHILIMICNLKKTNIITDSQLIEITKDMIINFDLFTKENSFLLKIKIPFIFDIYKHFEKILEEPFQGEKLIIKREESNKFIEIAFEEFNSQSKNKENDQMTIFEESLNFLISLIFVLFENNILEKYYNLFIYEKGSIYNGVELTFFKNLSFYHSKPYKSLLARAELDDYKIILEKNDFLYPQKLKTAAQSKDDNIEIEQFYDEDDKLLDEFWKTLDLKESKTKKEEDEENIQIKDLKNTVLYDKTFFHNNQQTPNKNFF